MVVDARNLPSQIALVSFVSINNQQTGRWNETSYDEYISLQYGRRCVVVHKVEYEFICKQPGLLKETLGMPACESEAVQHELRASV